MPHYCPLKGLATRGHHWTLTVNSPLDCADGPPPELSTIAGAVHEAKGSVTEISSRFDRRKSDPHQTFVNWPLCGSHGSCRALKANTWSRKAQTLKAARMVCTCSHGAHSSRTFAGGDVTFQVMSASFIGKFTTRVSTAADIIAAVPPAASQNSAALGRDSSDQTQRSPPSTAANVTGTSNGLKCSCWICWNIIKSAALSAGRAKLAPIRSPRMIPA
jgi:hypothetical protein